VEHDQETKQGKKHYEKPMLRTIELVAEEVLAVGCKLLGRQASLNPTSCMGNSCSAQGS
jgi:hypothetical protein